MRGSRLARSKFVAKRRVACGATEDRGDARCHRAIFCSLSPPVRSRLCWRLFPPRRRRRRRSPVRSAPSPRGRWKGRRERQARWLGHHHLRDQRSDGQVQLPGREARARPLFLAIRAVGYELEGPRTAEVAAAATTTADVKLRPTRNLAKQLTNAEWLASFPGTDTQKKALLNCISCHDLDRIVNSNHDADEFVQVFDRMTGYYPGSTPQHPQRLIGEARRNLGQAAGVKAMAEYLASVNLSKDEVWEYPLKTLPRPEAARPAWSSPNTTCRASRSSRMTPSSTATAWSGSRISASSSSAASTRRPARSRNIRCR